jgi:hypothetical protein
MNNNFTELAEQFLDENPETELDYEELESRIYAFLGHQGIDEAWIDEAANVVREHYQEWS